MENERKSNIRNAAGRDPFLPFQPPPLPPGQASYAPINITSQGGTGTLDLNKVATYFSFPARNTYTQLTLAQIRTRFVEGHFWHPPTLENLVEAVFETYCEYLKGVGYSYMARSSPFSIDFTNQSSCYGRALGFLQLLTIVGLPADKLFYYTVTSQSGVKICAKHPRRVSSAAVVEHRPAGSAPPLAPNAIQLQCASDGKVLVERTDREPFASHDATFINIPTLRQQYWDPLLMASYANGFSDRFAQYKDRTHAELLGEPWATLAQQGLRCYINEGEGRRGDRIYYLPRRSLLMAPNSALSFTRAVREQANLREAYAALEKLDADPCLAVIFDQEDWNYLTQAHPPALRALFS